ncbi:BTAD domain-containing putative transcriptional regulator [Kitasatospora sp. NPDC002965]|uniref:AfsR/SARP family transcriptional regulator n=1 Tax=Kitasatospora sp. NPDC002965 TaxID=3154775 RepID=UPI0033BC508B
MAQARDPARIGEFDEIFADILRSAHRQAFVVVAQVRPGAGNSTVRDPATAADSTAPDHTGALGETRLVDFDELAPLQSGADPPPARRPSQPADRPAGRRAERKAVRRLLGRPDPVALFCRHESRPSVQFGMLGPLSVRVDGGEREVPAPRQRVVLALLLINANRVVSVDRIAAAVWDGGRPPSAAATVRTYVMRLRQVLGGQAGRRILTSAPGYRIELDEDETDLGRFTAHRARAAAHIRAGELEPASAEYSAALELWRGEPLVDIPSRTLREVEGRYLHELRLQTVESRLDVDLALGRHAEIMPELWREVQESPLREALVSRLMLALFRAGRQSEALALFQLTRTALIDQLGAEPGPELREMQRRILAADDSAGTDAPKADTAGPEPQRPGPYPGEPRRPRPAQLPAGPPELVGRSAKERELANRLLAELPTAAVTVVTGSGGIGKSVLALRVAHGVRDRFGHGQLYADLGGTENPAEPGEVLARFLTDLGVAAEAIPADPDQAALLYRSLTADRRVLVVLDDARGAAQVRPLLPGGRAGRVIVTSRDRLADLDGAHTILLEPLDEPASLELLGSIVGHRRVEAEPQAARSVVRRCAGLPLAVRIVGARYLGRPHWDLGRLAARLARSARLLDELRVGDLGVRIGLERDYRTLQRDAPRLPSLPDPAAAFRMLGAVGAEHTDARIAAVLLDCQVDTAEAVLETLADAHLLHARGCGRYHLDDLLRAYARERAEAEDPPERRAETLRRLLTCYLRMAEEQLATSVGHGDAGPVRGPAFGPVFVPWAPAPDCHSDAEDWWCAEQANLRSALELAATAGLDPVGHRLRSVLGRTSASRRGA